MFGSVGEKEMAAVDCRRHLIAASF